MLGVGPPALYASRSLVDFHSGVHTCGKRCTTAAGRRVGRRSRGHRSRRRRPAQAGERPPSTGPTCAHTAIRATGCPGGNQLASRCRRGRCRARPLRRSQAQSSGSGPHRARPPIRRLTPRSRASPGPEAAMAEEAPREAHLPAQRPASRQEARLPAPHVHARGPRRPAGPPPQGPPAAVGLIWRIRDRRTVRRSGAERRSRRRGDADVGGLPSPPRRRPAGAAARRVRRTRAGGFRGRPQPVGAAGAGSSGFDARPPRSPPRTRAPTWSSLRPAAVPRRSPSSRRSLLDGRSVSRGRAAAAMSHRPRPAVPPGAWPGRSSSGATSGSAGRAVAVPLRARAAPATPLEALEVHGVVGLVARRSAGSPAATPGVATAGTPYPAHVRRPTPDGDPIDPFFELFAGS